MALSDTSCEGRNRLLAVFLWPLMGWADHLDMGYSIFIVLL